MHESSTLQGQEQESPHHLCYTALQKLAGFFGVTSNTKSTFYYEGKSVILC